VNAAGGPNEGHTDIYGFAVYTNGELRVVPGSPAPAKDFGGGPITISRDSKLLYSTNFYEITAFQINADGSLTNAPSPSFSIQDAPVGLVAHPKADFLYGSASSGVLSVFTIDSATGALNLTSSVSLPGAANGSIEIVNSAVITPNGRYLYQNEVQYEYYGQFPSEMQIAGFSIDSATGALSPVPGSPVSPSTPSTIESSFSQMATDPAGKFLYLSYQSAVVNVGLDGGVAAYSIDPTSGELSAAPGSPFNVGGVPNSIAIDASGKFLIASIGPRLGGAAGSCLAVLSIDSGTGALTPVPGSPFGPSNCSGSVAANPSGPFVYAGTVPSTVSVFSIDQATGALAPITQTAVPVSIQVSVSLIALTH